MSLTFNPTTGKFDAVIKKASKIKIADAGAYYTGTEVEAALQEIGADLVAVGDPGGLTTQLQYNDAGAFAGDAAMTFNKTTKVITFGGRVHQTDLGSSTYFGFEAGLVDSLATRYNTGYGYQALRAVTSGRFNHAFGVWSQRVTSTSSYNCSFGYASMYSNTTGHSNSAYGHLTLYANNAIGCVAIGTSAGAKITSGNYNVAIGLSALSNVTTATYNTAVGTEALFNCTGSYNMAIGAAALRSLTSGQNNMSLGANSLYSCTGSFNTGAGGQVLYDVSSGEYNTAIGYNTGRGITTGSYNTIIGSQVTGLSSSLANNVIIADGQGNQRIRINSDGKVGLGGITSPTAYLHLPACTASADTASLKIEAGTLATTPVSGNIESDGTNLYWTDSDGTRRQLNN